MKLTKPQMRLVLSALEDAISDRETFDSYQHHTHNWHAMADTLRDIMNGTPAPKPPEPKVRRR